MPKDSARFALVLALVLALLPSPPSTARLVLVLCLGALLAISMRRDVRLATIVVVLVGGVAVRIADFDNVGSDVLWVTTAAIERVVDGQNPYGVGYTASSPDGAPFPYGPVSLLWYLPLASRPDIIELGAAVVVAVVLAVRGRLLGLVSYAISPLLIATAVDGSNDTSLGLLLLAAFMVAGRWPAVGAVVLAVAVAFKLSALAFVPAFVAWGGRRIGLAFVAGSLIAWAPVLAGWGISSFVQSLRMSADLTRATTWSIGKIVRDITNVKVLLLDQLRYVFGGALALATMPLARSLDTVILAGSAVYLITLYGGNWGTYAYVAGIAPLICWRLDDWLGLESRPLLPRPTKLVEKATAPEPDAT